MTMIKLHKGDPVMLMEDGRDIRSAIPFEVLHDPGKAGGFRLVELNGAARVYWLHDEGKTWRRWMGPKQ